MTVENPKKLGFGLMRLPRRGVGIDIKQMSQMVDLFMEAGCTYFDTAHVYLGSEEAARKALVERYPRESFTLATKLSPAVSANAPVHSTSPSSSSSNAVQLRWRGRRLHAGGPCEHHHRVL